MRKIVLQMMTTLNGRLDDPYAWITTVGEDQYRAIDSIYATYDTVLVGRTTFEEMAAYWPDVLAAESENEVNLAMARRMNDYKKLVFTKSSGRKLTEWNNTEQIVAANDQELASHLTNLKAQPGGNIHLSGGASLAQSVIALDLVDEFHFFVYPVVSPGATWFARLPENRNLQLLHSNSYENGVVSLHYLPIAHVERSQPDSFSELLL